MRPNMAGVARPGRIAPNSSFANSTARSIFSSASKSVSSITCSLASFARSGRLTVGLSRLRRQQRADPLTTDRLDDGVLTLGTEDQHGQPVFHAEAQRR